VNGSTLIEPLLFCVHASKGMANNINNIFIVFIMKLFRMLILLAKIDKNPNITKGIWEKKLAGMIIFA
jgi:hypothetical protein